jgi:hypothetical protein
LLRFRKKPGWPMNAGPFLWQTAIAAAYHTPARFFRFLTADEVKS